MDAYIGQILDAIEELAVRDDTIVVFTSDNGPDPSYPYQGSSGPWRGYYFTHMEGSLRTPFIIRWPNKIPAGRVSNEIMREVDAHSFSSGSARALLLLGPFLLASIEDVPLRAGTVARLSLCVSWDGAPPGIRRGQEVFPETGL